MSHQVFMIFKLDPSNNQITNQAKLRNMRCVRKLTRIFSGECATEINGTYPNTEHAGVGAAPGAGQYTASPPIAERLFYRH